MSLIVALRIGLPFLYIRRRCVFIVLFHCVSLSLSHTHFSCVGVLFSAAADEPLCRRISMLVCCALPSIPFVVIVWSVSTIFLIVPYLRFVGQINFIAVGLLAGFGGACVQNGDYCGTHRCVPSARAFL